MKKLNEEYGFRPLQGDVYLVLDELDSLSICEGDFVSIYVGSSELDYLDDKTVLDKLKFICKAIADLDGHPLLVSCHAHCRVDDKRRWADTLNIPFAWYEGSKVVFENKQMDLFSR